MPSACSSSWATYGAIAQPAHVVFARRTMVVSGGGSAWTDFGALTIAAAPANERPVRKRRRLCRICMDISLPFSIGQSKISGHSREGLGLPAACSAPQLALQLVDEAPIRAIGDDLPR